MTQYEVKYKNNYFLNIISCIDEVANTKHYSRYLKTIDKYQSDTSGLVEYTFNKQGYRSNNDYEKIVKSLDDYIICIGCSHTEGIGVDLNDTWCEQLGKMLSMKTINLGLTSASIDYCILQYYILQDLQKFQNKPKYIFILYPPVNRFGIFTNERLSFFQEWNFLNSNDWKTKNNLNYSFNSKNIQITNDKLTDKIDEFDLFFHSNYFSIKTIVNSNDNTFGLDWDFMGEDWPLASDELHFDKSYHTKISETFYEMIN